MDSDPLTFSTELLRGFRFSEDRSPFMLSVSLDKIISLPDAAGCLMSLRCGIWKADQGTMARISLKGLQFSAQCRLRR
jgi:hypothetical protein